MSASKQFKPIEIEVEEIVGTILENDGIPCAECGSKYYYIEQEGNDEDIQAPYAAKATTSLVDILRIPQTYMKKRKISEPIVDYSESQVFTSNQHIEALESIMEKKHSIALEKQ